MNKIKLLIPFVVRSRKFLGFWLKTNYILASSPLDAARRAVIEGFVKPGKPMEIETLHIHQ